MKLAKADDWKTEPLPQQTTTLSVNRVYSAEAIGKIQRGFIPEEMEDKWFIYWQDDRLIFHRSWTGYCIYQLQFQGNRATSLTVNREPTQYNGLGDGEELAMALFLIDRLLLDQEATFPIERDEVQQWAQVGRASLTPYPDRLQFLPCLDSQEMGQVRRDELQIPKQRAIDLSNTILKAADLGFYVSPSGLTVEWGHLIQTACAAKKSIPPDLPIDRAGSVPAFPQTRVQVTNETTLGAARRLLNRGLKPIALNFANGVQPGGGFLKGARAQEENLCRSSGLYATLVGDPMYAAHAQRPESDSTDWAIYSPDVPIVRLDDGTFLEQPYLLSFITCAAPYAPSVGQPRSGDLLQQRMDRVLAIARFYQYSTLILGAWGCGAFGNDPRRTAQDFRQALGGEFAGVFGEVVFAVADWSDDRTTLGPFREVFSP